MKLKVFNTLVFLFLVVNALAQYSLSGKIISREDSAAVRECAVYLNNGENSAISDHRGNFVFDDLSNGKYVLHFVSSGFAYQQSVVNISGDNASLRIALQPRSETLKEILITDQRSDFGFTRMHAVENLGIYEGKKSEVIIPEQLVANLATNNARQVYSRVAGLNIWENDGAGLQLSIGGRGLDPNRTSNFNVRQNGYDISADALGYPESYYTPPVEAIGRIEIVRGAASLQYGTQFGGLINFVMKKPVTDRKMDLVARQSVGSFNFYNAFTSASGTVGKLSYYTFFQYKTGDGWRNNSNFNNHTYYANVNYKLKANTKIGIDFTHMDYLAQQPGGLTDQMFEDDPRQSNRERNWFKVNWNLLGIHFDHKFSSTSEFNLRAFGLSAYRYSVGFRPNRVATVDDNSERDLIKGAFTNWGAEARFLKHYEVGDLSAVLLLGSRFYYGYSESSQGFGSTGKDADFAFYGPEEYITYNYGFPNRNTSAFLENIIYVNEKLSFTPGLRFEYINTTADGFYGTISKDLAGNVIDVSKTEEMRNNTRQFVIAGLGLSYKPTPFIDIYSNICQNYRSITFNDMRISNPSSVIDPNMSDEKGYSFDIGVRSDQTTLFNYDISLFYLNYNNRIGEVQFYDDNNRVLRRRSNIGRAVIQGIESYAEADLLKLFHASEISWSGVVFSNLALISSGYRASEISGITGNRVEFVPDINFKSGVRLGYKSLKMAFQYTYLSDQFTDATNASGRDFSALVGLIPAYSVLDASLSYQVKKFKIEANVNNLGDRMYFTRRATGYPGPGILPSDGRSFYMTLQVKI